MGEVWALSAPWWVFVLRAVVVYLLVMVLVRVSGKRAVGQFTPFDLVLLILIGNAVQNGLNGGDNSVTGAVILAGTLILLNFGVAFERSRLLPMIAVLVAGCLFGFLSSYMAPALHEKDVAVAWFFAATVFAMLSTRFLAMSRVERLDHRLVVAGGLSVMAAAYLVLSMTTRSMTSDQLST